MTYDPNAHHGYADQKKFMEIPISEIPALTAIEEPTKVSNTGEDRRYAQLVYQVNTSPIELSGDVMVDTDNLEAINSDGFSTLSTQMDNIITSGIIEPALSMHIECNDTMTWVAEAVAGTALTASMWRIKQIETITISTYQNIRITWADGDGSFNNIATSPLSALTYV